MLDADRHGIGGNHPPAFDPEAFKAHEETVAKFMDATQQWLKLEEITSEEEAGLVNDQIFGLRQLHKKVDEARKEAKKPHDDAGKAVQSAFTPLLTKLKTAADALKPKLAAYTTAKAEAEAAEKARQEEEARAKREAAEMEAKLAAEEGDIAAQVEAEAAVEEAAKAEKEAAKPVKAQVKSASGAGRTMAVRKEKVVKITNINLVFMAFRTHPDVQETLHRLATQRVRAKDYEPGSINGIEVTETQKIA